MKWGIRSVFVVIFMMIVGTSFNTIYAFPQEEPRHYSTPITEWQYYWDQSDRESIKNINAVHPLKSWTWRDSNLSISNREHLSDVLWIKFRLPAFGIKTPAIFINKLYANQVHIYLDNEIVYKDNRTYMYDLNTILLPLNPQDEGKEIVMILHAQNNRLGMAEEILVGDYQTLLQRFNAKNLIDIILGSSIIFIAIVMLICTIFLRKAQIAEWVPLNVVLFSIGILIITYSPFLYTHYGEYGTLYTTLFDIALFTFLPGLTYIFESMIGKGYGGSIRKLRKFQMIYSLFCFGFMLINMFRDNELYEAYYVVSVSILGILIIIQAMILMIHAIYYAIKGNKDAGIIALGFSIFSIVVVAEFIWFYMQHGNYEVFLWKWGLIGFLISLIAVLGRKLAINHIRVIEYSKELERFNNELQRSEKMDIISELAASVAHEVRNPLQVTRGFLQLLEEKSKDKEKGYLKLALEELDRASEIITDFLTFAKPEIEQVTLLDIFVEFKHIEGILLPLANYQGGRVQIDIPSGLMIRGNISKFKQAFINMIKNSIEALGEDGIIRIWAYQDTEQIVIHIYDNGEGMEVDEIKRLGEPYYSNKTRGTGLGLMVTFRIIEAMKGSIMFTSEKGIGTEVVIRFPVGINDDNI
ncbi:ATP-binding protein [Paenibacillus sp. FA6]|uniref:ATP-binding protein n=1 Tax=Paenibacillus sp. FA6 TaxID=3413029 RepID=UPI003F65B465